MTTTRRAHQHGGGVDRRALEATRLVASTCSRLPVDFWQRRVAARAFAAPTLPPVARDWPGGAALSRCSLGWPLFLLQTSQATWALSPGGGHRLADVAAALAVGHRTARFFAVLAVAPTRAPVTPPLLQGPHAVGGGAPAVGALTWSDAAAIFEDAGAFVTSPTARSRLRLAVTWLRVLDADVDI